jgi:hypothetical protein
MSATTTPTSAVLRSPATTNASTARVAAGRSQAGVGRVMRLLGLGAAVLSLLAVFAAYLDPHLAVDLANRFWSCF